MMPKTRPTCPQEYRRRVVERYLAFFRKSEFENVYVNFPISEDQRTELNYAYFPVVVQPHGRLNRDRLYQELRERRMIVRKYYYPTVLDLPVYQRLDKRVEDVSNAASLSKNILCLPVTPQFDKADCDYFIGQLEACLRDLEGG